MVVLAEWNILKLALTVTRDWFEHRVCFNRRSQLRFTWRIDTLLNGCMIADAPYELATLPDYVLETARVKREEWVRAAV